MLLLDKKGDVLLEAEKVSFRFALLSLFSDMVKMNSVLIEEGAVNVMIDYNGNANYDILKSSDTESSSSDFSISIEEAQLENMKMRYQDKQTELKIKSKGSLLEMIKAN